MQRRYYRAASGAGALVVAAYYALVAVALAAAGAALADPVEADRVHACTIPAVPGSYCAELDARLAAMHAARPGTIREGGQ